MNTNNPLLLPTSSTRSQELDPNFYKFAEKSSFLFNGQRTHSNWDKRWSDDENARLKTAVHEYGDKNWKAVAAYVGTRDAEKCMQRWQWGLRPDLIKGRWSAEEDRILRYLVQNSDQNWSTIARQMKGRNSKQCRERWKNYLNPALLLDDPFTKSEDEQILKLQRSYGNKWADIARHLPGRTENNVKRRFHALIRLARDGKLEGYSSQYENYVSQFQTQYQPMYPPQNPYQYQPNHSEEIEEEEIEEEEILYHPSPPLNAEQLAKYLEELTPRAFAAYEQFLKEQNEQDEIKPNSEEERHENDESDNMISCSSLGSIS